MDIEGEKYKKGGKEEGTKRKGEKPNIDKKEERKCMEEEKRIGMVVK